MLKLMPKRKLYQSFGQSSAARPQHLRRQRTLSPTSEADFRFKEPPFDGMSKSELPLFAALYEKLRAGLFSFFCEIQCLLRKFYVVVV